mgnify:CR=1 FL=1
MISNISLINRIKYRAMDIGIDVAIGDSLQLINSTKQKLFPKFSSPWLLYTSLQSNTNWKQHVSAWGARQGKLEAGKQLY